MPISVTPSTSVRVVHPGDDGWDAARGTFNVLIDQQPEAIAFPADEREVAAVLADARERGLRVALQATGHNPGPLGSLEGTLILNTSALTGGPIDAAARRVRAGAATRWEDVTPGLSELGLAGLHGSSPDVGIVGYSLGGGIGWLARKHGMQTNAVTAIELVTAEGRLVRTDAEHEPDLFWALRGGGGNFGVVTAHRVRGAAGAGALRGRAVLPRSSRSPRCCARGTGCCPGSPRSSRRGPASSTSRRCRSSPRRCAAGCSRSSCGRSWARPARARALSAAARARPGAGHVRRAAADRPRRPGDGPARPAAVPQRARPRRRPAGGGHRRARRIAGPGSALDDGAAAPLGRRARPAHAGRRSARHAARRDLRARLGRARAGRRAGIARRRRRRRRGRAVPRRRLPELRRGADRHERLLRRRRPGSACGGSKALYDPRDLFHANHRMPA